MHVERIDRRAPGLAVREVDLRDRTARAGGDARLEPRLQLARDVRLVVDPGARFEQQPCRPDAGPFRLGHVVLLRLPRAEGVLRPDRARAGDAVLLVPPELDDAIHVEGELVLRAHLPREARHEALDQVVVGHLTRRVRGEGRVARLELVRRIEGVCDRLVHAPVAHRAVEPQTVRLERSARRGIEIVDAVEGVAGLEPFVHELLWQRIGLQRRSRSREEDVAAERVAAVLRDHVQAHAAAGTLGGNTGSLIAHLREHAFVEVLLDGAVALDPVQADAVHHDVVVFRIAAVRRDIGLLHPLRAADVGL